MNLLKFVLYDIFSIKSWSNLKTRPLPHPSINNFSVHESNGPSCCIDLSSNVYVSLGWPNDLSVLFLYTFGCLLDVNSLQTISFCFVMSLAFFM